MDISDATAVIALLISVLAAVYSRWAWAEAKKANDIALHPNKKSIYDAFFELKAHMTQKWDGAEMEYVGRFYYPAKNSHFYFDENISKEIYDYYQKCFYIADRNKSKLSLEQSNELMEKARIAEKFANRIETKLLNMLAIE